MFEMTMTRVAWRGVQWGLYRELTEPYPYTREGRVVVCCLDPATE